MKRGQGTLNPWQNQNNLHLCSKYSSQKRQHSSAGAIPTQGCLKHMEKMLHSRISSLANWEIKLTHICKTGVKYITYHHIPGACTASIFYLGTAPSKGLAFYSPVKKKIITNQNQTHLSCSISPIALVDSVQWKALMNLHKHCFLTILP